MPDANVARLRWLMTEAVRAVNLNVTTQMINRMCAEQDRLMRDNGMALVWESEREVAAAP